MKLKLAAWKFKDRNEKQAASNVYENKEFNPYFLRPLAPIFPYLW